MLRCEGTGGVSAKISVFGNMVNSVTHSTIQKLRPNAGVSCLLSSFVGLCKKILIVGGLLVSRAGLGDGLEGEL